ncbi:AraC family transcriptional regulator [Dyadobacter sp. NIV53]|uniref:helix-turn-helix domain-containing protein n=1 Tax=Dyadobacter sp. NIV53 TaxID=2861765 RepID=UPI001C86CFD5|nr:helix-turn-helix domain-containing protein [Dyadobacter sp. NIV53]
MKSQTVSEIAGIEIRDMKLKGFKVYEYNLASNRPAKNNESNYYMVSLISGHNVIHYADQSIVLSDNALVFANSLIPYSLETQSADQRSYMCVFTDDFLKTNDRSGSMLKNSLFGNAGLPVFSLNTLQAGFIRPFFQKMLAEQAGDYIYKDELMRNYLSLIVHEVLKMQPIERFSKPQNAANRITGLFLNLLEKQFPIENPNTPLVLRTAHDYATGLAVHINHLNRVVKEVTGRPTTNHISERVIIEAKTLLKQTDWNITDVAYSLGFDSPTYFNNFFKKMTGTVPKAFR